LILSYGNTHPLIVQHIPKFNEGSNNKREREIEGERGRGGEGERGRRGEGERGQGKKEGARE